jgi:hypothetical protein
MELTSNRFISHMLQKSMLTQFQGQNRATLQIQQTPTSGDITASLRGANQNQQILHNHTGNMIYHHRETAKTKRKFLRGVAKCDVTKVNRLNYQRLYSQLYASRL